MYKLLSLEPKELQAFLMHGAISVKSIFSLQRQVFALVSTVGMLVSYVVAHRFMKDLVRLEELPFLLGVTYILSVICALGKKKNSLLSDLITAFFAYNLTTWVYLTYVGVTGASHENLLADLIKCLMVMLLGYPVVILTLLPALIFLTLILAIYRKSRLTPG